MKRQQMIIILTNFRYWKDTGSPWTCDWFLSCSRRSRTCGQRWVRRHSVWIPLDEESDFSQFLSLSDISKCTILFKHLHSSDIKYRCLKMTNGLFKVFVMLVLYCSPSTSLEKYLECMDKLQKSVQYFTANNPDSPEMSHVVRFILLLMVLLPCFCCIDWVLVSLSFLGIF